MDVYIGLGSNLGDRRAHLQSGVAGLEQAGVAPVAISSVWESEPMGSDSPEWFLNMAVRARTTLDPRELLALLLELERRDGRTRSTPNAPRTLDLDLLLAGELELDEPGLTVPHPRMWERGFVLEPLAEIGPQLRNPANGRTVEQECHRLRPRAIVRRLGDLAPASGPLL
jgi:2-amino-4-hydroxy-6-hydroxymethyldihydropteridine diphosphokinase